jgi:flagellar biosynthesis/type III secretory pathway M-ring protein FliF/YscJ
MVGNWRWNVGLGIIGAVLTLLFSIGKNPLSVMLMRSMYAFIAFVAIAFVMRIALAFILTPPVMHQEETAQAQEDGKGTQLDLQTPDESEDLNQLLRSQLDSNHTQEAEQSEQSKQFKPLTPPKLVSTQSKEPEELAKAIRHMTGG